MIGKHARFTAAYAEQLLAGSTPVPEEPLQLLLAAATAPGHPDELAGENTAVRAFHLARRMQVAPPLVRLPRRRRARWGIALVAKLVAILLASVGAAWALAASTGVLPSPWERSTTVVPPASGGGTSSPSPAGTPGSTTTEPSTPPSGSSGTLAGLEGQCRAFFAHDEDPSTLKGKGFEKLVQAAGGIDQVPAFCRNLLGIQPTPSVTG